MPEHAAPEPLMPLLIARKPGGKPLEVLIDEATGERLLRDIAVALAGIRAAKAAVLAMTAPAPPPGVHPYERFGVYSPCALTWDNGEGDRWMCSLPPAHGGQHEAWISGGTAPLAVLAVTPPGEAVDATIHEEWCDGGHDDAAPCPPDAALPNDRGDAGYGTPPTVLDDPTERPAPSASDEVRAAMLDELRSRPGYPHGGGRAQMAAQRAMDEQQVDAAIADGLPANTRYCPDGPTVEHGPCARLAGHPVPHRDIHGSEWFPGGGTRAPEGQCGEAWPADPALTCFREPGHHGQHAAAPDGERQTRTWPNANDDSVLGEPDEQMPVSYLPLRRAALIGGGA